MKPTNKYWYFLGLLLLVAACTKAPSDEAPRSVDEPRETNHPFLIVKKEQFASLRQKSDTEPWRSMKLDALSRSAEGYRAGSSSSQNAYALQRYVGAAALAYILDEANATVHANRVRDAIVNHYSKLTLQDGSSWSGVVPPTGSFFVAILSLDIVYDALSLEDIRECETIISDQIFRIGRSGSWVDARRGTHGTWDIYKGDRTTPDDDYYNGMMYQVTEDGVSPVTIHYAWERVGGGNSRVSKSGYMDVLEFTGIDQRYYNNERLQKFQRWLFGSSVNNSKEMAIIGDMLPTQRVYNDMLHRRVVNFDMEAAAYTAWFHEGTPAIGNILTYIIPRQALPAPRLPESQLYENGGAFFREKADNPDGIHAVLYNISSQDEWHTHQETNGLALSAYGNRLLVNGGRLGAPTRPAPLNNTLAINGEEHNARLGGGLIEGFTTNELDYACGEAGRALRNATHHRSLLLVHPAEGTRSYCVLFDEVEASVGDKVHSYLHPANENSVAESSPAEVYQAAVDHYPSAPGANLSVFYATTPDDVHVEKVPSAVPDRYPNYPDHNRLEAIYNTDAAGKVNVATILFPHHSSQPKPVFQRSTDSAYSGGAIHHDGDINDYFFTTNGEQLHTIGATSFQARAVLYRQHMEQIDLYFIRQGNQFSNSGLGFESENPVSIYFNKNTGKIVSPGTKLSLKGPGVETIQFTPAVTILNSEAGKLEVELPEGTFEFN